MTMHLIQGVNTSRTKKLNPKMTKENLECWAREMQVYNKEARQRGEQRLTLDQYIDYAHGKGLPKQERKFEEYKPTYSNYRETTQYKSNSTDVGVAAKKEPQKYTGTLVKGIATMHKSNAVPIIDEEQARDISRMRR